MGAVGVGMVMGPAYGSKGWETCLLGDACGLCFTRRRGRFVKPLSETMLRAMFPAFDLAEWMAGEPELAPSERATETTLSGE